MCRVCVVCECVCVCVSCVSVCLSVSCVSVGGGWVARHYYPHAKIKLLALNSIQCMLIPQ